MEKQPHTHSGLQAPLCGANHNNNPQDGQQLVRSSALDESAVLGPRFSMVLTKGTSAQYCAFTERP